MTKCSFLIYTVPPATAETCNSSDLCFAVLLPNLFIHKSALMHIMFLLACKQERITVRNHFTLSPTYHEKPLPEMIIPTATYALQATITF